VLGLSVVIVLALAVGAVGATDGAGLGAAQQTVDADTVSLRVGLAADGSADWRVTYRVELETDNETAAFEDLAADVAADPAPYVDRFGSRMRRAMWTAENATGRDMTVGDVSVEARTESLPQGTYGVVVYRLEWTGFAAVADDGTITAGDAIDEFFLDDRTSLTVAWPADYGLVSHEPSATAVENGSLTWQGRRNFGPGEPRVVVAPGVGGGEAPGAGGVGVFPILVALALFFVVGGWLYYRRERGVPPADEDVGSSPTAAEPDEERDDAAGEDAPPAELLSNEERVLSLLEREGGRLKQQQVAAELDWTDAKTSQVVSDLREAGDVESFRLGRENVLTLPDVSIEPGADDADEEGEG
jgi:hypothetical protein